MSSSSSSSSTSKVAWDSPEYLQENARSLVHVHVATKTWQAGCVVTVAGRCAWALVKRTPPSAFVRGPVWAVPVMACCLGWPLSAYTMNKKPVSFFGSCVFASRRSGRAD